MPTTIIPSPIGAFTAGVRIETPEGLRLIEQIAAGDRVNTLDHGPQVVRAVRRRAIGCDAPVRFAVGSVGNAQALGVAPTQRILISDWRAELMMGCDEVLASAIDLVNGRDVCLVDGGMGDYFHLLFDHSQIVFAEGCAFECALPDAAVRPNPIFSGRQEVTGPKVVCLLAA